MDINVSSVIDDVTRQEVRKLNLSPVLRPSSIVVPPRANRKAKLPKIKWMSKSYYLLAERLNDFYGYLFLFENALRQKIDAVMTTAWKDWWELKVRHDLSTVYKYARDEKVRQAKLPMIGATDALKPIDYLTLGHLEQIIVKYQSSFVPSVFPQLHFFTGHMVIVKRVRNAIAHMAPSTTPRDIRNAKSEIDILLQHFSTL